MGFSFSRKNQKLRTSWTPRRCRPTLEILEARVVLSAGVSGTQPGGLVTGTVFRDLNANGTPDPDEPGLANRVVYVDADNNGQPDPFEVTATTDASGGYTFNLPPGQYSIRLAPGIDERPTSPTGGSYDVTVTAGFAAVGRDFGVLLLDPAEPLPQPTTPFPNVSTANEAYIQGLYRDILGRNAGPAERTSWEGLLTTGQPVTADASRFARLVVASLIWNSAEHRNLQVESYYRTLLGRGPDAAGKAGWVNAMLSGASEVDVLHGFLTSPEYQALHPGNAAFVEGLYHDLLGRAPDAGGELSWDVALHGGVTRTQVIDGFFFSNESLTRLVDSDYAAFLHRPGDVDGTASWLTPVQERSVGLGQAATQILASDEFFLDGLGGGPGGGGGDAQDVPFMPTATVSLPGDVLWYDFSANEKTITITNNDPNRTIFPFLEDANSRTQLGTPYAGTGTFDPYDPLYQEYRGYIGYETKDGQFLGLRPGQTITVNVPLAFWDSGRMFIASSGTDLLGTGPDGGNPFLYHSTNTLESNAGSTTPGSNVLTFTPMYTSPDPSAPPPAPVTPATLVPGLVVTGPGIPAGTTVLAVTGSGLRPGQIMLSQNAVMDPGGVGNQTNVKYSFQWPTVPVQLASWADNVATITARNSFVPGQKVVIAGMTPAAYNGAFTITSANATGFTYALVLDHDPGPVTHFGTASLVGPDTARVIVHSVSAPGSIGNGLILWYHALGAEGPANDAPAQLTEMTYRGDYYDPDVNPNYPYYLIGAKDSPDLKANDFNLINYDVSYVDSMMLPVAMEAADVGSETPPHQTVGAYGWVGSSQTIPDMQAAIAAFAGTGPANGLGSYFGADGPGYPSYFNPNAKTAGSKLPSGQNLLLQSPFEGGISSYPVPNGINNTYALTSGGSGPIQVLGGIGALDKPNQGTAFLYFDPVINKDRLATLAAMWDNGKGTVDVTDPATPTTLMPGTTVKNIEMMNGVPTGVVELSQATIGEEKGRVYNFKRPVTDYSAGALLSLWYSWAAYYVDYVVNVLHVVEQDDLGGSVTGNTLTLDRAVAPGTLVPGMLVTNNPGIPAGTTITAVTNNQVLSLSQVASGSGSYDFIPPSMGAIAGSSDTIKTDLHFSFAPGKDTDTARQFAQTVYQVMSAMSTVPPANNNTPTSIQLLENVIGCNTGFLTNINKDIEAQVTNYVKALLRGVPSLDLKTYPQSLWYPDPSTPTGGQTFNAYNLDPFVWFVHEKLGLSGYGFSVDDDVADVGANYATHLLVAVGGLGSTKDFPNQSEWTYGAPFGPVHSSGTASGNTTINGLDAVLFDQVRGFNPPSTPGAHVNVDAPGVSADTTVDTRSLSDGVALVTLTPGSTLPSGTTTYWFFGPVTVNGTVSPGGTAVTGLDAVALATLKQMGPQANLVVNGPGISTARPTKVLSISDDGTVTLDTPLDQGLVAGRYAYTIT